MSSRTLHLAAALLLAASAALGQAEAPAAPEARQIDSYGKVSHCDWTARLDNFAIELMNNPAAQGYVVSYDAPGRHAYAARQLRGSRHYLSDSRGIDPARLVLVEGGTREDLKEGQTDLWLVPAGAEPPVAKPPASKYAGGFSGKFESFAADPNAFEEIYEMSAPDSVIARAGFAEKLKQQPESVGYVVIRAPRGGAPGAWRRLARRDEQRLQALGVDSARLRSLDGGTAAGREAEIEFWVLPPGATPPADTGRAPEAFTTAAKLHTFEAHGFDGDEETEKWMLENLAEFLREHPRATALIVAREPPPEDEIEWATEAGTVESGQQPEAVADSPPTELAADEAAGEPAEPGEPEPTLKETAEAWKTQLIVKHGIDAGRVAVVEGRPVRWPVGRLNLWVVPEEAKRPDPSAPDEDEAELEELHGIAVERGANADVTRPR